MVLPVKPPSPFHRLRSWLLDEDGFRAKVLGAAIVSLASIAVLAAIFLLVAVHFYEAGMTRSGFELSRFDLLKTIGYVLGCMLASAALLASTWYTFDAHAQRLATVEQEGKNVRAIIDASPSAILTVDVNGVIGSCNPATDSMFGYEHGTLVGQRISKLIPQRHFLHDVAAAGRGAFLAFGQRHDFVTFPLEVAVSEVKSEGRRLFIVMLHDASERRYSQETVHHISLGVSSMTGDEFVRGLVQQLSQMLQNDFAFLLETDTHPGTNLCSLLIAEQGRIRSVSHHVLGGTAFQEALDAGFVSFPRKVRERFPHDDVLGNLAAESFVASALCDHMGRAVGVIGVIGRTPLTNLGVAKQTLQIFADRAAAELERKQQTEVLTSEKQRLHGDFTVMRATAERDRLRYEEDIAAEQEMLAVTLRSIREGCITTDNDGRIVTINPVAEELTGWTEPEAADRRLGEVVRLIGRRNRRPLDGDQLIDHPDLLAAQMVLISREKMERIVEVSVAPIRDRQDQKLGTVLVFRDVTEKSRAEEERHKAEKLESLGLAAGGIAHDFNNLLTAIIGNLSLAMGGANSEVKQRIDASKKASLRAQDLAQQLLTFAKGGAPIKKTASMRQLVLDTIGFSLSGTNIRSEFAIPDDLWPVDIDAGQISQVITNLAVNAVQAMAGGGTVHVTGDNLLVGKEDAPPTLKPGRYVRIGVRDEGPGIPEEIQKKIFDPYFTTKPKGSGLGLATSYSIVKNHDGLIALESPPGEGARFVIYLPASDAQLIPELERAAPRGIRKGKILVMDDEEASCELVSVTLSSLGFTVVEAYDAPNTLRLYEEALKACQPFDLVIMDLTIPGGMGGKEAVKRLKQIDPGARAIVSSGYAMDPIMSRYRDYGFSGVIAKPYDVNQLEQVIHDVLG